MRIHCLAVAALGFALTACGGGGGSSGGSGSGGGTANRPPAFTSGDSASVTENTTAPAYSAAATDPDGNNVVFSITGGPDASRFSITAGGSLSFAAAPNFDLPADANLDNIYQVTVAVSDGLTSVSKDIAITVANSTEGVSVQRIATGIVNPVAISAIQGTRRLVIVQRNADVVEIDGATGAVTPHGNLLSGFLSSTEGIKVIGAVTRPDFATTTPTLFFAAQFPSGAIAIYRALKNISLWASESVSFAGTGVVSDENTVAFAYTDASTLYAAISDGSGAGTSNSAQDPVNALGKILKIEPNPDPFAGATARYFFVSQAARGVHQPTGASVIGGDVFFGDRGNTAFQEINRLVLSAAIPNFAWPFKEGTQVIQPGAIPSDTDPALQYPFGTGPRQGTGVVGGQPYQGTIASLANFYVFADRTGRILAAPVSKLRSGSLATSADIEVRTQDFAPNLGSIDIPVGFANDSLGTLYLVSRNGEVFRVSTG